MHFTLKQLRYFVTAGEFGSVTKAAKALYVSQPSISSAILHIEDNTGLDLFIRHHAQGLTLTPAGHRFLLQAKQLLDEADSLGRFASSLSDEISGSLKFVSLPTFAPIILPAIMRKFVDQHPQVNLQCDEADQAKILAGLLEGRYEFAVTYDLQLPAELDFAPIVEFPPYVMLPLDHALAAAQSVSIRQLAEHPMILLDWPMSRDYFYSLFLTQGLEPHIAYRANSLAMVRGLVANGLGFALFNTPLASDTSLDGHKMVMLPVTGNPHPTRLGIANLKDIRNTPAAKAFINLLTQQLSSHQ